MIAQAYIEDICRNLEANLPLTETLPEDGILHIDKLLPYICVYRYQKKDLLFSGLIKTQASYLLVKETVPISDLLDCLAATVSKKLNAFMILELWPVRKNHQAEFELFCPKGKAPATVKAFKQGVQELQLLYPEVSITVSDGKDRHPDHLEPILDIEASKKTGSLLLGLAVPTLYERPEENEIFSIFYRKFTTKFSEILKRAVYEFIRVQTANPYNHYLMLGKTNIDRITLEADKSLSRISEKMSFLMRTTPVNSKQEWVTYQKNNFEKEPSFTYRLIALDPEKEKRKLYDIPIEKVDDPTLSFILRDKRLEIEKQLTMLEERGTSSFRFIGESLYGGIRDEVLNGAHDILNTYTQSDDMAQIERFNCYEFAHHAQKELDYYQEFFPQEKLQLEIREDVAGIMVAETSLFISSDLSMDARRCDALIQHEIGTHILTYCNGRNQPIKQMYAGFSGYDQLQEGLAVIAEYLVGGLTMNRLRLLAGRVVAANSMSKGASFNETFKMLTDNYNFQPHTAYYISMRIYRGGGLTKDAVYLAGLLDVLEYLENKGSLHTLYTGKFNINHVALIEELLHRKILKEPVLPRFLERETTKKRLDKLKKGLDLTDLLKN